MKKISRNKDLKYLVKSDFYLKTHDKYLERGEMKNLIIVESPTKAKTLARFLGSNYRTIATFGHIRDLPKKSLAVDIKKDFKPKYIIPAKSRKIVKILKELLAKTENLWLATDFDREGEAIAWHVVKIIKPKIEPKRITFHEITKSAILKALKKPRQIDEKLVSAQQTRRILDRLVGYKLSPFLWRKITSGLSAGRVQSVATRLVFEREQEIKNFKAEEYWQIIAELSKHKKPNQNFKALLVEIDGKKFDKLEISKNKASRIIKDLARAQYRVKNLDTKEEKRYPSPPFVTSTLQQEASYKLGFTAKKTMMVAQQLYEGIKISQKGRTGLITYMRTDSTQVARKAQIEAKKVIEKNFGKKYSLAEFRIYKKAKGAQEAHEAIRPTIPSLFPDKVQKDLTRDQAKLYGLIWKRFIASQMKEAIFEVTIVDVAAKKYLFRAKGERIKFLGFLKVYGQPQVFTLPALKLSEILDLLNLSSEQHFTNPTERYTEATLIKALEKEGVGRPSTYAPTISTIQDRDYVIKKGKYFYLQELGEVVTKVLKKNFPKIVDIGFTAKLEKDLDDIASGNKKSLEFLQEFWTDFEKNLKEKEKDVKKEDLISRETDEKCPECGKKLEVKFGRFGKFLSCTGYPDCKYSKPLAGTGNSREDKKIEKQAEEERCEKCGAEMVIKESRFGPFLACSRYPKCKFTKSIIKKIGLTCPECGKGDIIERRTKRGKIFWGCTEYPKCRWASWQNPKEMKNLKQISKEKDSESNNSRIGPKTN